MSISTRWSATRRAPRCRSRRATSSIRWHLIDELRRRRVALHARGDGGAGQRHQARHQPRRRLSQFRDQAVERLALRRDQRLRARRRAIDPPPDKMTLNRWIVTEAARAARDMSAAIEAYRFNDAANAAYRFVWNIFCDWYLELAKPVLRAPTAPAKDETRACTSLRARSDLRAAASVHAVHHRGALGDQGRGRRASAKACWRSGALACNSKGLRMSRPRPRSAGSSI